MPKGRTQATHLKKPRVQVTGANNASLLMPPYLGDVAKAEFVRLAAMLKGEVTEADANALGQYCQAFEHKTTAERNLAKEGFTIPGPNGMVRQNPNMQIANEASKTMERIGKEFGMTPLSRKKMAEHDSEPKAISNAFVDFMAEPQPTTRPVE